MSRSRAPLSEFAPTPPAKAPPAVENGPLDGYGNAFLAQLLAGRFGEEGGLQALGQASAEEGMRQALGDRSLATGAAALLGDLLHEGVDDLKDGAIGLGAPMFKGFGDLLGLDEDDTEVATGVEDFRISAAAGFAHGAIDLGAETGQLLADPRPALRGLVEMAPHLAGPLGDGAQVATEFWASYNRDKSLGEAVAALADRNKTARQDREFWSGAWDGLTAPIREDWAQGRPGEAVGRGVFDLLTLLDPAVELAEGAAMGVERLGARRAAATEDLAAQAANKAKAAKLAQPLTVAEVQQGLDSAATAMGKTVGDPLLDASKVKVNLMGDAEYLEEASRRLMKQNPNLSPSEALDLATQRPCFVTGAQEVYIGQSADRAVLKEALTHEVGHVALHPSYMGAGNEAINEAVAQWLAKETIGPEARGYPQHVGKADEMAAILGKEKMIERIRGGEPWELRQALEAASPGSGDRLFGELDQIHADALAGSDTSTATSGAAAAATPAP